MEEEHEQSKLAEMFPHSIELTKGQKGGYGWTIKVRYPSTGPIDKMAAKSMAEVVRDIDLELRNSFKDEAGKA